MKKGKRILALILAGVLYFSAFPVNAADSSEQTQPASSLYEDVIEAYLAGNQMENWVVEVRKKIASDLELTEYLDERFFLTPEYHCELKNCNSPLLEDERLDLLIEMATSEEMDMIYAKSMIQTLSDVIFEEGQEVGVTPRARVTGADNNYFTIEGATSYGYCAENSKPSWDRNVTFYGDIVEWDDARVRKVLYYSPGGPGYVESANGLGYDMDNATYTIGYLNGNSKGIGRATQYLNYLSSLADPLQYGYKAYKALIDDPYQDVAFLGYFEKDGSFRIKKISSHPHINDDVSEAEFSIYSDSECENFIKTLTIWRDLSDETYLNEGTYYLKETKAPEGFVVSSTVYTVFVKGGEQNYITISNTPEDVGHGYAWVKKTSMDPSITESNECYSFYGAEFGIYSDPECSVLVEQLYTPRDYVDDETSDEGGIDQDENGVSYGYTNTVRLAIGTYYVKELKAPEGYKLSDEVKEITIEEGQTASVEFSDEPILKEFDPYSILLRKYNIYGTDNSLSLAGAEFTLNFYEASFDSEDGDVYDDWYDEEGNPKRPPNTSPTRSWVLRTDEYGYCRLAEEYKVSGDDFYISPIEGLPSLPRGILIIKETKAPEGYLLNEREYGVEIMEGKDGCIIYNEPQIPEISTQNLTITKSGIGAAITSAAEFTHIKPDGTEEILTTSLVDVEYVDEYHDTVTYQEYQINLHNLAYGDHVIYESKAPDMFQLNESQIKFTVSADGITFTNKDSLDDSIEFTTASNDVGATRNNFTQDKVIVYDKPKPLDSIIIRKNSSLGYEIGSAEFTHVKPDGTTEIVKTEYEYVERIYYEGTLDEYIDIVSENRVVISDLEYGDHVIYESKAPPGYELNPHRIEFTVSEEGITYTNKDTLDESVYFYEDYLFVDNVKYPVDGVIFYDDLAESFHIRVNKKSNFGESLDGAEFTLYDSNMEKISSLETKNGTLLFDDLQIGETYYLQETKVPEGYTAIKDYENNDYLFEIMFEMEVESDSEPIIYCYFDGEYINDRLPFAYGDIYLSDDGVGITCDLINNKVIELPVSGSSGTILIVALGVILMIASVLYMKEKKKRKDSFKEEKRMKKKITSCLLALVLMATTVFAGMGSLFVAEAADTVNGVVTLGTDNGSITIQGNEGQTLVGKTFNVYQIMTSEQSADGDTITYEMNEAYADVVYSFVTSKAGTTVDTAYKVATYLESLTASEFRYFVEELRDAIVAANISASDYYVVNATSAKADNSIVLDGLSEGYYIVDEVTASAGTHSASSMCMVNTASPDVTIDIKSDYPSVTKKIEEDDNNIGWNDIADYEIGQTVPYKYTSNVPDMSGYATYYYAWHDVMDEALTFNKDSVEIVISNGTKDYTLTAQEFVVTENVDGETFKAEIADLKAIVDREFAEIDAETGKQVYGQTVTVTYNATLNDKAAVDTGRPGFENDVRLEFSNDPDSTGAGQTGLTIWDTVVCFTYKLDVLKTNDKNKVLENAKFHLYSDEDCTQEVFVKASENGYIVINEDSVTADTESVDIVSNAEGKFAIVGLDGGTYYLKETDAPDGYKGLTNPIKLTVTPTFTTERQSYVKGDGATAKTLVDLQISAFIKDFFNGAFHEETLTLETDLDAGSGNLTVINYAGSKLPVTGSSAMLIMLGVGVAAMTGSVVYSKRKEKNEE